MKTKRLLVFLILLLTLTSSVWSLGSKPKENEDSKFYNDKHFEIGLNQAFPLQFAKFGSNDFKLWYSVPNKIDTPLFMMSTGVNFSYFFNGFVGLDLTFDFSYNIGNPQIPAFNQGGIYCSNGYVYGFGLYFKLAPAFKFQVGQNDLCVTPGLITGLNCITVDGQDVNTLYNFYNKTTYVYPLGIGTGITYKIPIGYRFTLNIGADINYMWSFNATRFTEFKDIKEEDLGKINMSGISFTPKFGVSFKF